MFLSMEAILVLIAVILVVIVIRVVSVVLLISRDRRRASIMYKQNNDQSSSGGSSNLRRLNTCAVLGSGGHTTEMIQLLANLSPHHYYPISFVVAKTDTTSVMRLEQLSSTSPLFSSYSIYQIPRAREVGQSYISSVFTTLHSLFYSITLVLFRIRPDVFICT